MRGRFNAAEGQLAGADGGGGAQGDGGEQAAFHLSFFDLASKLGRMDAAKLFYQTLQVAGRGWLAWVAAGLPCHAARSWPACHATPYLLCCLVQCHNPRRSLPRAATPLQARSHGFLGTRQEVPYGDILLTRGPLL